jgi:hypothetical protein
MTDKISYNEFSKMLRNVDVPEEELAKYVNAVPSESGAFNIKIEPNPDFVQMSDDDMEYENAMSFANNIARWRRSVRFKRYIKKKSYKDWPVLVSEGDSWFQFPILIKDVIDHLSGDYLINSLGAAGDTAENIANGPMRKGGQEYFRTLKRQAKIKRLDGFLFSAAGNDVIGEDPHTGGSMLATHLKPDGIEGRPRSFIDQQRLDHTMKILKGHYNKVIKTIRQDGDLKNIPIFIHGYDYCFPGGHVDDPRKNQLYAKKDKWLGSAFKEKGIRLGRDAQRDVIKCMIDDLYNMMSKLIGQHDNIHVIDVRNTLNHIADWKDEIHGTSDGFKAVAKKFDTTIRSVI